MRGKSFDEQQALEAAMRLFWTKGYAATSLQDLEAATGLNRTSLYNAFGNKNSLFKKALGRYMGMVRQRFREIIDRAATSREAVQGILETVVYLHFSKESPGGCLAVLSAMESSQHDAETLAMTAAMFGDKRQMLIGLLERGKARGEFHRDFDVTGTATALAAVASGMVVLAKAGLPATAIAGMIQPVLALLDRGRVAR
jgi:TetR/AcrR family transcriptional repressor of nem operon